jgi:hypothetical protein
MVDKTHVLGDGEWWGNPVRRLPTRNLDGDGDGDGDSSFPVTVKQKRAGVRDMHGALLGLKLVGV